MDHIDDINATNRAIRAFIAELELEAQSAIADGENARDVRAWMRAEIAEFCGRQ